MSNNSSHPNPDLYEITEVNLYNPSTDEDEPIRKAGFESYTDIFNDNRVIELRNAGWIMTGLEMSVGYRDEIFTVTIGTNSKIGYVKIEDIGSPDKANELRDILRSRYLDHFRLNTG